MVAAGAAEVATAVVDSAEGVTTQVEAQELVQALVYPWAGMAALGSADDEAAAGAEVADETTLTAAASLVTTVTEAADDSAAGADHEWRCP